MNEHRLSGIVASEGLAIGPLVHWKNEENLTRSAGGIAEERAAFSKAVTVARKFIVELAANMDAVSAGIMEFQSAMLQDDEFLHPVETEIDRGTPAHIAWRHHCETEAEVYLQSGSEHKAARVDDLYDIRDHVLRALSKLPAAPCEISEGSIIFAKSLTPSAFLAFDWSRLQGAALQGGSPTSHVSILARARGVPLVVGLQQEPPETHYPQDCVLDAMSAHLIINPSARSIAEIKDQQEYQLLRSGKVRAMMSKPAMSADKTPVKILINIDEPAVLNKTNVSHCDGVGLMRTEFLITGGRVPDEESQYLSYRKVLDWAEGRPVTIRTFDAGGDKPMPGVMTSRQTGFDMGLRGIRLSLTRPEMFKTQLRALARANIDGNLKIMVPMVSRPEEMVSANALLDEVCDALAARKISYHRPQLGMMVEVPAAALSAELFNSDFFSIGSNDLAQYTMAAARDNALVSSLFRPVSPAVMELISRTITAARVKGIDVNICGEIASSKACLESLLQLGLRTFSVSPALIGRVKLAISQVNAGGGVS